MASRPPEFTPTPPTDRERTRWFTLVVTRFIGFAIVLVGILMSQGAIDLAGDVNTLAGYMLIAVGLVDGFVVPQILARKWRTPPE